MRSAGRKKASDESAKAAESSEATLDLGREASESYKAIIKSKPKRAIPAVSSPPSKVHLSSDGEPMLPDYPVNADFDSRVLARAQSTVDKAFANSFGWRAAFEEASRLELQRAKSIYNTGVGKPLLEQMEKLATHLLKNFDKFVQESTGQPPKQVRNPKNLELQSKIDTLEKLLVEYEKELADWEQVEQSQMRTPAAPEVQRRTKTFPGEEEDAALLASMHSLASIPREVLRAIHLARLKVERADQILTQAERETADIVAQYSQQVLGDGVDAPKAVIKSLTMDG